MSYSLNAVYEAAGITKQAVWQHFRREEAQLELFHKVKAKVDQRRAAHPGQGLEKLYWQIQPEGMGRDKFCRIFGQLGYGVRPPKNRMRTTIPAHKIFENLIEGRTVGGPCQVWQSDITYIKIGEEFYYLTFIIDVYTRRIVGYATSKSLRAEANLKALKMAIDQFSAEALEGCVHHSDRGSQYTDGRYLALLRSWGMPVSMGGKATENAFAERINGVIKNEYLIRWEPKSFKTLRRRTRQAVADYNTKRHHGALGRLAPAEYEQTWGQMPAHQRPIEIIRSENTPKFLEASLQTSDVDTTSQYPYCMLHVN